MTTTADDSHTTTPAELFWEARGTGPAVLLVPPTPGDGGQFAAVAESLAHDHLVVTYDRRGTSRSPRPPGWTSTTVGEHADDAAAVLSGVGVDQAVVFGTSTGAAVALELALRHPRRVGGALLHELPLLSVLADPEPVAAALSGLIGPAVERGGPAAGLETFLRFAYGDAVVDGWDEALRSRLLSNAEMALTIELPAFQAYRPEEATMRATDVPFAVLVGDDQPLPFFAEAAAWLASRLATTVTATPGAHGPQFTCPGELAATIRSFAAALPGR